MTLCLISFFFSLLLVSDTITASEQKPIVLPLQTMKISSLNHPRPASKLLFRYNYSLVVPLKVGSPPQEFTMVVDTGSELTWLQCVPSQNSPTFNPKRSTTYGALSCDTDTCKNKARDLPSPTMCDSSRLCHFTQSYADASTSEGNLATDTVSLGGLTVPNLVIGCATSSYSSTKDDKPSVGLIGMNRGALSFVSQVSSPRFSYCISDHSSSGVLVIGDTDPVGAAPSAFSYTPLVNVEIPLPYFDRVAYSVQLVGIRVAGKVLPLPKSVFQPDHTGAGQTMIDSGTQFTLLLGSVYTALKNEFLLQTRGVMRVYEDQNYVFQGAHDLCYRWAGRVLPRLPPVVLMFNGAEMAVSGERLLYKVPDRAGVYCFTFGNSDLVPVEAYIIGHHHQQNMWVEYDLERSRLGFAPARCDLARQMLTQGLGA